MDAGLSPEKVTTFTKRLRSEPRYLLAQNVSTCIDPLEVCLHRQTVQDTVHIFQHSIPTEGKPITNQKSSGRCWIFSCLNVMRLPFIKKFNLEEFEFSQSYLFFWDKVMYTAQSHYYLIIIIVVHVINTATNGVSSFGILCAHLFALMQCYYAALSPCHCS
ncbi:hypothetical protein ILYODFUR_023797 [Ilyodon furcidens]|uniref:Bleomycin hydrolase n=1 Tax=Ilyodon furcidens TaxID=33524 RepID=A0ABV0T0Z3_9TELE